MANTNKIFDRETLLDLTVNIIPLFIIFFFVVLFLVVQPWGGELFPTAIMVGLHVIPFVGLAILTYFSGKAIAGAEKSSTVYYPGQAGMPGAEADHGASDEDDDTQALESGTDHDGELTDETEGEADDAPDATDDDSSAESAESDDSKSGETDTTERQQAE